MKTVSVTLKQTHRLLQTRKILAMQMEAVSSDVTLILINGFITSQSSYKIYSLKKKTTTTKE